MKKTNGVSIASLVCGVIAFILNPFYLTSVGAIATGIVGLCTSQDRPKTCAALGLILGFVAIVWQIIFDLTLGIFFCGGTSFCF